ncbi:transcriptional regulator [Adlercreutzia sp. ZJ473]|uniref:transcriptional regulator n=1 Tax=Adlercreutzia sp. ZJ473 TaxID=2722822 RepID=UPI001552D831|nr:transcriptional regulator [Adlercreutzia sp. ZJ473]
MDQKPPRMLTAEDVMARLSVSKSTAYLVMRDINSELEKQGLRVRPGRVSQKHFDSIYFGEKEEGGL